MLTFFIPVNLLASDWYKVTGIWHTFSVLTWLIVHNRSMSSEGQGWQSLTKGRLAATVCFSVGGSETGRLGVKDLVKGLGRPGGALAKVLCGVPVVYVGVRLSQAVAMNHYLVDQCMCNAGLAVTWDRLSLSIYLSIYLFIRISIYLYLSIYLSIYQSIYLSIHLSIYGRNSIHRVNLSLRRVTSLTEIPEWESERKFIFSLFFLSGMKRLGCQLIIINR